MKASQSLNKSQKNKNSQHQSQMMFGRPSKTTKNSILSSTSSKQQINAAKASIITNNEDMKMEEVTAMEVDEIVTRDRDDPIIKSGLASRNHHLAMETTEPTTSTYNPANNAAAPNSPPSRQQSAAVTNTTSSQASKSTPIASAARRMKTGIKDGLKKSQKLSSQPIGTTKNTATSPSRSIAGVGSFADQVKTAKEQKPVLPSTLDPSNPLAHTTATRLKKLPARERSSFYPKNTMNVAEPTALTMQKSASTKMSLATSQKFKIYNTLSMSTSMRKVTIPNPAMDSSSQASPKSLSMRDRNGLTTPALAGRASPSRKEISILHSQAAIQRSRDLRLGGSGTRSPLNIDTDLESTDMNVQPLKTMSPRATTRQFSVMIDNTDDTVRDEIIDNLKNQLEYEQKKQYDMKRMFDETMENMEVQARQVPAENVTLQTNRAVDQFLAKGKVMQVEQADEISKLKQQLKEKEENERDLQSQNQQLEKQLLHSSMRVKEAQAKEQVRVMQQENDERRFRMQVDKLRDQVKDLMNTEERLKSDHAQQVVELMDQVESERQKQAVESEERFMAQINDIRLAHARERENLVQQKFAATQELQMIKMDHSELIRNTNFDEQREFVETVSILQTEIASLKVALAAQHNNFEIKASVLINEKEALDKRVAQLEISLAKEKATYKEQDQVMRTKNTDLEVKLAQAITEKDKLYKTQMEKIPHQIIGEIQTNLDSLKEQIASTNQSLIDQSIVAAQQNDNSFLGGSTSLFGRLNSSQYIRGGDAMRMSSPRVPRRFANLNIVEERKNQKSQSGTRQQAPQRRRDNDNLGNSSEMPAANNLQDNNQGNGLSNMGEVSFLLDPVFLHDNYQDEAIMLAKLKALTNNFTCQSCWQVLSFARFFDEQEHECLKKVDLAASGLAAQKNSIDCVDSIEEFREAGQLLGNLDNQLLDNNGVVPDNSIQVLQIKELQTAKQNSLTSPDFPRRSNSAYYHRSSVGVNLRQTAQAALTGQPVVAEINLASSSRNLRESRDAKHSAAANTCESCIESSGSVTAASMLRKQEKTHSMQIDTYILKIKEYHVRIEDLEAELLKCKQENNSLIDDLRDTKTKVAVLAESKAQLQIEVTKMHKKEQSKINTSSTTAGASPNINQTMNVAANTKTYGMFTHSGGRADYSVKLQPALTNPIEQLSPPRGGRASPQRAGAQHQGRLMALLTKGGQDSSGHATSKERLSSSNDKSKVKLPQLGLPPQTEQRGVFRSPTSSSGMVRLSQKFSAYPTSDFKSQGKTDFGVPSSTLYTNQTRNGAACEVSMQSSQAQLISHSFANMTQQLNGSMQNLRVGSHTQKQLMRSEDDVKLTKRPMGEGRHGSQRLALLQPPCSNTNDYDEDDGIEDCENGEMSADQDVIRPQLLVDSEEKLNVETEADNKSVVNPVVTPELAATSNNRCSLFKANSYRNQSSQQMIPKQKNQKKASPTGKTSPRLRLNNPYDTITIARSRRVDSSPDMPNDQSLSPQQSGVTRRTIFPAMRSPERQIRPIQSHQKVQVKQAVPIRTLALDGKNPPNGSRTAPNNPMHARTDFSGAFGTFGQPSRPVDEQHSLD